MRTFWRVSRRGLAGDEFLLARSRPCSRRLRCVWCWSGSTCSWVASCTGYQSTTTGRSFWLWLAKRGLVRAPSWSSSKASTSPRTLATSRGREISSAYRLWQRLSCGPVPRWHAIRTSRSNRSSR